MIRQSHSRSSRTANRIVDAGRRERLSLQRLEDRTVPALIVSSIAVNGAGFQRSNVFKIVITFSESLVNFSGAVVDAFTLTRQHAPPANTEQPGLNGLVNIIATQPPLPPMPPFPPTSVYMTFRTSGANPVNGVNNLGGVSFAGYSLPDGTFDLGIDADQVSGVSGALDGNADGIGGDDFNQVGSSASGARLFRLYGDIYGDGAVASNDFTQFRFVNPSGAFDYNNDGDVSGTDFSQFRLRFGSSI